MNNCNCCCKRRCQLFKLTHSRWKNGMDATAYVMVGLKFKAMVFYLCEFFFLPGNYTNILPTKDGNPDSLVYKTASKSFLYKNQLSQMKLVASRNLEFGVAHLICKTTPLFLAFHSQFRLDQLIKTVFTLFQLLFESINSPAMVFDCMKIIKRLVYFLNPSKCKVK